MDEIVQSAIEITHLKDLQLKKEYFSRSMNQKFMVLKISLAERTITIGFDKKAKTIPFLLFNKQYMEKGVILE